VKPIEARDLSFSYFSSPRVLRGVNLEVERGEIVFIKGKTGSGKTTLLYALSGIIPHLVSGRMKGEVKLLGRKTMEREFNELAKRIGVVMQNPEMHFVGIPLIEELKIKAMNMGMGEGEAERRAAEVLRELKAVNLARRLPDSLSGGQKQIAAFALAVVHEPEVLFLDEPLSNLDVRRREIVKKYIERIAEEGRCAVIAERRTFTSGRVLVLKNGRVVSESDRG